MNIIDIIRNHGIDTGGVLTSAREEIAASILLMGQSAAKTDTFPVLADKIMDISNDATADPTQVYIGETFYAEGMKKTGTMPDVSQNFFPGAINVPIPAGYHDGTGVIVGDVNLVAGNIVFGKTIFGVDGAAGVADTNDANLVAQYLLIGYSGYDGGVKIEGTMPDSTQNLSPGAVDVTIPAGYHDGSGKVTGDPDLVSANIKAGKNIFGVDGDSNVVDTSDADLNPAFLLIGYSGYDDGVKKSGTMPNVTQNFTPSTTNQTIPAGYHSGAGFVAGDVDLISDNIRAGITLFGVPGNPWVVNTSGADNDDTAVLAGKKYYALGVLRTGTMPNQGAPTWTPGTTNQSLSAGYYSGGTVVGDADLVAGNIKKDVNIFGVTGSYVGDVTPGVLMAIDPIWEKYQDTPTYNAFNDVFESASDGVLYLIQPTYHTFARVDRTALGKQVWVVDYGSGSTVKWAISPSGEMYGFVHQANDAKYLRVYQKSNGNAYIAISDPAFFATLGGDFAVFSNGDVLITYYDGKIYRLSISSALSTVWSVVMPSFSAGCKIIMDGSDNFYLYGDDVIYKYNSSGGQTWGPVSFPLTSSGHNGGTAFLDPVNGNPTILYDGFGAFQADKSDGSLVYQITPSGSNWAMPLCDASGNMFAQQQTTKLWERWNAQKTKKLNSKTLDSDSFYYSSKFSAFDRTVFQTNSLTNRLFIHATAGV